mgnify:CR=1 FL=1
MKNLTVLGHCPDRIIKKAILRFNQLSSINKLSKKLSGVRGYYSIKVSDNYRVLFSDTKNAFLCSHNQYDKKIKNIKRQGA